MNSDEDQETAVELLQELGLREYEAKSFVALSRLPEATAKKISEVTDVPRTRVYDAIRILEAKGLVQVQHSNPQQFRAVPIEEAVDSVQEEYESRLSMLREALEGIEQIEQETDVTQEIWAMSGSKAIAKRTENLINEATTEIVIVIGSEEILTEDLLDALTEASKHVNVIIGATTEPIRARIQDAVPNAIVFISGLEWLHDGDGQSQETAIGRLLLIDRETLLVSSIKPKTKEELGIFGRGFGNGLVVIARRLMATGLIPAEDPANGKS